MTIETFCEYHRQEALKIMADKTLVNHDAQGRADQLVVGLRHVLCAAILTEAEVPEKALFAIARRVGVAPPIDL